MANGVSLIESATPFGEARFISEDPAYGGKTARTLAKLAHQLMYGSERRRSEVIGDAYVNISVSAGHANHFFFPQVHGAALSRDESPIVVVESHSLFRYQRGIPCTPSGCSTLRGLVVAAPMEDFRARSVAGAVSASPLCYDEWMRGRIATAACDGASGYSYEDEGPPLDPRESLLAREVLAGMLQGGHVFDNRDIQAYAVQLTANTLMPAS